MADTDPIKLCIPDIGEEELALTREVLQSGWLAHGPYNHKFEEAFADYIGVKHAISCNSCTSALFAAVDALGIGGEVIVPSFSWVATANIVVTNGATPIFADIEYDSCNIDPAAIEAAITPRTEAIIPVHFGGQMADMDPIMAIAEKHGLAVIEDTAETIGGTYKGRQAGSIAIGCYSFFPTKNMTTGEGGMLTTNDDALNRKVRALIAHGMDSSTFQREKAATPWYRNAVMAGHNFRMPNAAAAMGYVQLGKLDAMNARRRKHAARMIEALSDIEELDLPREQADRHHVYQMFTVKLARGIDRDGFVRRLNEMGIGASVHFYPPIHEQEYYRQFPRMRPHDLSVTEDVSRRIVSLPMYPGLSDAQVERIVDGVRTAISGG